MAQKGITLYTATGDDPHIAAGDDAAIYRGIFGSTSGITEADNLLACAKVNDTTVSIDTGVFSNQGFMLRVDASINLTVDVGTGGFYRKDLVCAEYTIGGGAVSDTHELVVVKGTPNADEGSAVDPTLQQDSLITGTATDVRQEALYRLTLSGTTLSATITQVADYIGSYYA
jgi:hypothetical protein